MVHPVVEEIIQNREFRRRIRELAEEQGDGLTDQAIFDWRNRPDGVPVKRVMIVSQVTGKAPHEIRGDVFPKPQKRRKRTTR